MAPPSSVAVLFTMMQFIIVGEEEETGEIDQIDEEEAKPTITENDIMLVASQSNVDPKEAEIVLKDCDGDIAKAILFFKNRP